MIKRYITFVAVGDGNVRVEGLCDAARDPLRVAMARCHELNQCSRVKIRVSPAFEVPCSGTRFRCREDIRRQARKDAEQQRVEEEMKQLLDRKRRLRDMFINGSW